MNLIRDLLLFHESDGSSVYPTATPEAIRQHHIMLIDGEFIHASYEKSSFFLFPPTDGRFVMIKGAEHPIYRLTWLGHEFIDAARDNNIWNTALKRIESTVSSVPITILKEYLEFGAKDALEFIKDAL